MKDLETKIQNLELEIYAGKALLRQQVATLHAESKSTKFIALSVLASFAFGYFLVARRGVEHTLLNIFKKAFSSARLLLSFFPL